MMNMKNMMGAVPGMATEAAQKARGAAGMQATAGINPVANPLGAMAQFDGVNPPIDPTAGNFSPVATAAGAGIHGTYLDKQLSFMNPGLNTSAVV